MTTIRIGLLAFDGCDAMDLIGPYEVLLTANRLLERDGRSPAFEVVVVGDSEVRVYGGLRLAPDVAPEDVEHLDVLVVPGAIDLDAAQPDQAIRALAPRSDVLASVCTGAFFLQRLGLVDGREVTTHWEDAELLRRSGARVRERRALGGQRLAGHLGRDQLRHRDDAAPRREVRRPRARRSDRASDRLRVVREPLTAPLRRRPLEVPGGPDQIDARTADGVARLSVRRRSAAASPR